MRNKWGHNAVKGMMYTLISTTTNSKNINNIRNNKGSTTLKLITAMLLKWSNQGKNLSNPNKNAMNKTRKNWSQLDSNYRD